MGDAVEIPGVVFANASATLLARMVGHDGLPLTPAAVAAVRYGVYLLGPSDPYQRAPVAGHQDAVLAPDAVLFAALQNDVLWDVDDQGYNFRHALDVSQQPAFPTPGRHYLVEYRLAPVAGQEIVARFRLWAV
ncbi:MAG: hypothetical protein GYA33_15395 [Thermogutta sp.]|nr:hypothetical protein [Thermogutta sp.]